MLKPSPEPVDSHRLSRGGPLGRILGVQVAGLGSYAPANTVRNEDLAKLGYDTDWIIQRSGIRERRQVAEGEATSDLCYEAALRCLEQAGASVSDIDLIIVGTFTPDHSAPNTACRLQHRLGSSAPAMDLNAACSGFMYSLVTAMQFVKCGTSRCALVLGADCCTRIVNPADKKTFPLFGDAAGAALLTPGTSGQGLLAFELGADGSGGDLLCIPASGTREPVTLERVAANRHLLQMDGRSVFKWAVRLAAESVRDVLAHAQLSLDDIDLFVPHQANVRIIDAVVEALAIDRNKVVVNLERYGNTSAGSIPLALDEAVRAGRLARGQKVLLCGFGAGLTWGTGVLAW